MKRIKNLLSIFAILITLNLSAQGIKITVRDANEPLPYANIYINGTPIKVSGLDGVAYIEQGMLHLGDTISSSYLGFQPAFVIYDKNIQSSQECTLKHIKEQVYEVENITVTGGNNGWEAFFKYARPHRYTGSAYVAKGNFRANIRMIDNNLRVVEGSFSLEIWPALKLNNSNFLKYVYGLPLQITTQDDTTNISRKLAENINFSFIMATKDADQLYYLRKDTREAKNPYRRFTYLGLKEGKRNFTITLVSPKLDGTNQAFIVVNAEDMEIESLQFKSTAKNGFERFINSQSIIFQKDKATKSLMPSKIGTDFRHENGIKSNLTLSDIAIQKIK